MRIFRIDGLYPFTGYAALRDNQIKSLQRNNLREYTEWVYSLKMYPANGYRDGYLKLGHHCIDHWPEDTHFNKKAYKELPIATQLRIRRKSLLSTNRTETFALNVLRERILQFSPDIIICHEHSKVPSEFFANFNCIKICRISSPIPHYWNPTYFDGIITDVPSYVDFLDANGIPTLSITNPFGGLIDDLSNRIERKNQVCFIGSVGGRQYEARTAMLTEVAEAFPNEFSWYGQAFSEIPESLQKAHKGKLTGIEMYKQYFRSHVIINDYIAIAQGAGVNQRIYESLGCGCHLITKHSDVLEKTLSRRVYSTFNTTEELIERIREHLNNWKGSNHEGATYIREHHSFERACSEIISFSEELA